MSDPFLGEIKMVPWNYNIKGWAFCNGQLLPINQNQALFSILGTTYGGNGQTTFALPDLRGRVPMHTGSGHTLGEKGGEESHTLTINELPAHTHLPLCTNVTGTAATPTSNFWAGNSGSPYSDQNVNAVMNPLNVTNTGGSQPHSNMAPYLTITFIIALIGIFPSQV
jgi:microcystin-dependent protein